MATLTFGVKLGTTGLTGEPNGHHGSGPSYADVQVSWDTTKVTTRKQLNWALREIAKQIEGSSALTP